MKVTLIQHTQEARELLLFSKQTRLALSAGLMDEIRAWPEAKKQKELNYILGTIQSSWEFIDYVFLIEGVSRAFTHQLVRTRSGSYAQQSQRTVDMSEFEYVTPPVWVQEVPPSPAQSYYHDGMKSAAVFYAAMIEAGANPQDARGVLPTNVSTNILAKFNLRALHDMAKTRLCTRTQGEYQNVFREMRKIALEVHPWTEPFIRVACASTGVCCFPNYTECPIKGPIFNPENGLRYDGLPTRPATKAEIQEAWEHVRYEAVPRQMVRDSKGELRGATALPGLKWLCEACGNNGIDYDDYKIDAILNGRMHCHCDGLIKVR